MFKCKKLTKKQIQELEGIISDSAGSGREVKRAQAVLLLNDDIEIEIIERTTKYKRRQIFQLRNRYLALGMVVIKDRQKGKPKELLTKKQLSEIIKNVKNKKPSHLDDYFRNYDYWTTSVLGSWIKRKYKVEYKSKTSVYLIFKRAKFTFHKPGRVYQNRDDKEVADWKLRAKPIVQQALLEQDTVVLAEDEMVLSTQTTFQKMWLPEGEYPKIESSNKKKARSVYGFLNIKTGKEHAFKTKWQNMHITAKVLKKIRKIYPAQKILLLWDGPGWHKGSVVKEFIAQDRNITTLHFPKYSPEENPQEHVWKKGRSVITHNTTIDDIDATTDDFVKFLNTHTFNYSLLGFSAIS